MRAILEFEHDITQGTLSAHSGQAFVCGDELAHEVRFKVRGAELSGATCRAYCVLSNRTTATEVATIEGNVIGVVFPAAFYALPGGATLVLRLMLGGMKYDVLYMSYAIKSGLTATTYDPAGELADISDLMALLEQCEQVLDGATEVLIDATTAARDAEQKAALAEEKAGLADTAAKGAEAAKESANTAAQNANEQADNAYDAAAAAIAAKDEAEAKAAQANTAAQGADASAKAATAAALAATEAEKQAEQAAQGADESAGLADTATGRANAAAASIEGLTVEQTSVPHGSALQPEVTRDEQGNIHIALESEQGEQGLPYVIKGKAYATVDALAAEITNPKEGDQYNVGATPPYTVYRWTGTEWEEQGVIKGEKGDTGNLAYATFDIDENGDLYVNLPDGVGDVTFEISDDDELVAVIAVDE